MKSLHTRWRISTFRLTVLLVLLFSIGNIVLLGLVYWQTSLYLLHRIDDSIHTMSSNFKENHPNQALKEVNQALIYDLRKSSIYGLFAPDGALIAGNIQSFAHMPPADGEIHQFSYQTLPQSSPDKVDPQAVELARAIIRPLSNGDILVVGRDFTQLAEIRTIILNALMGSGATIMVMGLIGAFVLSVRPLRRISAIRITCERIVRGEFSLRMPVSGQEDELDMLSSIVNLMLDEIERLLTEVKSVTDTVAHDLRTPLTRLHLLLQHIQQEMPEHHAQRRMLDQALLETDALLGRFRALLRISEIENRHRKAGFSMIDPRQVLEQIDEMFEALAEDKSVQFRVSTSAVGSIHADPELLFEALSNLVDNAIKFTPAGGSVRVELGTQDDIARIDIIDSGCGIDPDEQKAIFQRFYRGKRLAGDQEGYGLGLSIVAAIVRLHGFSLHFQDCNTGTHIVLICTPPGN